MLHDASPDVPTSAALAVALGLIAGLVIRTVLLRFILPLTKRTQTEVDELLVRAVATPAGLTLFLAGLARAVTLYHPSYASVMSRAFVSALVVVWGWALARFVARLLLRTGKHRGAEGHRRGAMILGRFSMVVAAVVIALTLLALWDVSITPLVAGAGIAGIALALAAQETLSNLFAGVAVYMDRIYEVGDYVVLDEGGSGELRGEVRDIGLRSTRILTRDDVLIVVPNGVIANSRVVNESAYRQQYRVRVKVQVAYESDLEHVERVLAQVGRAHPTALRSPEPRARVRSFDESGVSFELLVWIRHPPERGLIVHDLSKAIHARFREEAITIPYPQRVVHRAKAPDEG